MDRDVRGKRLIAVAEPVNVKTRRRFGVSLLVQAGHEHLETGLRGDAREAFEELSLVVNEVEVEPDVFGGVNQGEVGGMHDEAAEAEGAAGQAEEVVPLFETRLVVFGVAIDKNDVRTFDDGAGELAGDVGRRKKDGRVEEDVVAGDFDAGNGIFAENVVDLDVEAAEKAFHGQLEDVDPGDMKDGATSGGGSDIAEKFHGYGHQELMQRSGKSDLRASRADLDLLQRKAGGDGGIEVVAEVPQIGMNDPFLDEELEGVCVVERRHNGGVGGAHFAANPVDVDAEGGALAKTDVVRPERRNGGICGGWIDREGFLRGLVAHSGRGVGPASMDLPEPPAKGNEKDRGEAKSENGASPGHTWIVEGRVRSMESR